MKEKWVLIVEDEEAIIEIMTEQLSSLGFRVHACLRSPDAVRMLANQHFDCVLLDMCLEKGSGEQVVTAMRGSEGALNFKTPVIVMSGALSRDVVVRIRETVDAFFVKPFDLAKILAKVTELTSSPVQIS